MDVLLLEPDYITKYPPLGLMKIAYYHEYICNDFVWFAKGRVPKALDEANISKMQDYNRLKTIFDLQFGHNIELYQEKLHRNSVPNSWDRVYITSLFTFEWQKTIETIEYAKTLVKDPKQIYVGGICASLLSSEIEEITGIQPITGLLLDSSMIGFSGGFNIEADSIPHYGILDHVQNSYFNAYFTYTTRGCGMRCDFCAVQQLEPQYIPRISIIRQIRQIDLLFGPRKDLLLMDNNVLKSPQFSEIIDEIIQLGFAKGAKYINPLTKNKSKRYVDFNQGLDLKLINEFSARLLGKIALKPARIAFDHIEDKQKYIEAVTLIMKYGSTEISNYILYNANDFYGKGSKYRADSPEDLYERLKINVDLKKTLSEKQTTKVNIYSFPMKYIPLNAKDRLYIGPKWDRKHLRAIQVMLNPSQGKGVSGDSFFEASFGKDINQFKQFCLMPEKYLLTRGDINKSKEYSKKKVEEKKIWDRRRREWTKLYLHLSEKQQKVLSNLVKDNSYDWQVLCQIDDINLKRLYLHYFDSPTKALELIYCLEENNVFEELEFAIEYFFNELPIIGKQLCQQAAKPSIPKRFIISLVQNALSQMLELWANSNFTNDDVIEILYNVTNAPINPNDLELIQFLYATNFLTEIDIMLINLFIKESQWDRFYNLIQNKKVETKKILSKWEHNSMPNKFVAIAKEYLLIN